MPNERSTLIDELKRRGIRITPQRVIIFDAIEALEGHITAEDIYQEVQQNNPYISLATVYRTLELLLDIKLINQTNLGRGHTYYALRDHGSHHHLVCARCGSIQEFDDTLFEPLREKLQQKFGFQANTEHMSIFGVCQGCQKSS
jgi:Fur family ferric uptake transcriptional regulator